MAKKNLTSKKAKEILKDGTVHGQPLTDKQKRYFGWVAGGSKAKGGMGVIADDGKDLVMPQDGVRAHAYSPNYEGFGYSTQGYDYNPAWGGAFQMGGALPGATGMMYARTGSTYEPSSGKRKKAQVGMAFYQNGLDWKPKTISQAGSAIEAYAKERAARDMANPITIGQATSPINTEATKKKNKQYAAAKGKKYNEQTGEVSDLFSPRVDQTLRRAEENIADPIMYMDMAASLAPLAGKALSAVGKAAVENTALRNTYKLNPWAEKLNTPNKSYRVTGIDAYEDFLKTGVVKSQRQMPEGLSLLEKVKYRTTGFPSFQKGYADMSYLPEEGGVVFETGLPTFKRGELNPVTGVPIKGSHYAHRAIDPQTGKTITQIPASEVVAYGSKPHWFKGYQPLPHPTTAGSTQSIVRGPVDWADAVDIKANPNFDPRRYENSVKSPYTPPTTDPDLMARLKDYADGGVIKDNMGQWAHPGQITEIDSNNITMAGVPYPVFGVSNTGDSKLMMPEENYTFEGDFVTEYPMAEAGMGIQDMGQLKRLDDLTNFTNYNNMKKAKKGAKMVPVMKAGGDPDGEMALGQIKAMHAYLDNLEQQIRPNSDLEPWVNSKITLANDYLNTAADYLQYGEEGEESEEMKAGGGIPQRYKNMGFTRVGQKKAGDGKHKWKVLAKKGDKYKVVQGGWRGMEDYSQHGSEKRRKNFWNRMGGKDSSKAKDPFSPLYWHKRLGKWEEGGAVPDNAGFRALPEEVQKKILANAKYGADIEPFVYNGYNEAAAGGTFFELGGVHSMTQPLAGQVYMNGKELEPLAGQFDNDMSDITPLAGKAKSGIYIKPSKRGTFTAAAKKRGKGVQEFAREVMANKENYSPAMVKKANFARNAAGWKKGQAGVGMPNANNFSSYEDYLAALQQAQAAPPPSFPGVNLGLNIQNPAYDPLITTTPRPMPGIQTVEGPKKRDLSMQVAVAPSANVKMQPPPPIVPKYPSTKKTDYVTPALGVANYLTGLLTTEKQPRRYDRPEDQLYYNPYPAGTGSSALYEQGGWIGESNAVEYPYQSGVMFQAGGEMIKRADGSYSRRGLWDNIRANKGSGKKPTKEMLKQERKIKAKEAEAGMDLTNLYYPRGGEIMNVGDEMNPIARMGGQIRSNYAPSEYEEGGELSFYDDTQGAQPISDNPYSSEMIQFDGEYHGEKNGIGSEGIPINYGGVDVEVENNETGYRDSKGNFQILGNMKNPITNRKFKEDGKKIAKAENKASKKVQKGVELVNDADPESPYDRLKINSGKAKMMGGDQQLKNLAALRETFTDLQQQKLDMAAQLGIEPMEMDGQMQKAQDGKSIKWYHKYGIGWPDNAEDRAFLRNRYPTKTTGTTGITTMPLPPETPSYYQPQPSYFENGKDPIRERTELLMESLRGNGSSTDLFGNSVGTNNVKTATGLNNTSPTTKRKTSGVGAGTKRSATTTTTAASSAATPTTGGYVPDKDFWKSRKFPAPAEPESLKEGVVKEPLTYKSGSIYNPGNPILPSDAEPFDYGNVLPEFYALATNKVSPVYMQKVTPELAQSFNISLQNQLNKNQDTFRAAARQVGRNPGALSVLAAQKYAADQDVLERETMFNQQMSNNVYNANRQAIYDARQKNIAMNQQQANMQEQARVNTQKRAFDALSSIADKRLQDKAQKNTLKVMENLYKYRFGKDYVAQSMNPSENWDNYFVTGIDPNTGKPYYQLSQKPAEKAKEAKKMAGGNLTKQFKKFK